MEILPPFGTAIGRVGLSICFDVSDPKMNILIAFLEEGRIVYTIHLYFLVTIPRDQPCTQTSKRADHYIPICIHCSNRKSTLGGSPPCTSD